MSGFTDFIVAGPAGHTTAGPAGSFQAGPPGEVKIGEAGHVPIDTTPARVPTSGAGYVPIDVSPGRTGFSGGSGFSGGGGGFGFGGGGGGGAGGGGGLGIGSSSAGGGGGGAPGGATRSMMVSVAQNSPVTGGSTHYTPGGHVPPKEPMATAPVPGGHVPILPGESHFSPGGMVMPTQGQSHFTPGGSVTPTPGMHMNAPVSGHVPIIPGQSHFTPGGSVPMTPKVGIDPNMPHARVNPPRPGRVYPHKMTDFHGPRDVHAQNWPSDKFVHHTTRAAWEPKDTHSTWEPPKIMDMPLSMDVVDTGTLLESTKVNLEDLGKPRTVEQIFDFSQNILQDRTASFSQQTNNDISYTDISQVNVAYPELKNVTMEFQMAPERSAGALVAANS